MPYLLGIDIGTAGAKALLMNESGEVVRVASRDYDLVNPRPGWVEQDPADWWRGMCGAVREVCESVGDDVVALSISTQGDTILPVDKRGEPLRHAITWLDSRSTRQCDELGERFDDDTWYRLTGERLLPFLAATSVLWINEEEPDVAARTARFMFVEDYIAAKLTGRCVVSESNASRSGLCDISTVQWHDGLCDAAKVTPAQLSKIQPSGTPIGPLGADAARELGLSEKTLVAVGGHDQVCGAVGAGVLNEGDAMLATGTAWVLLCPTAQPRYDPDRGLALYCHAPKGTWLLLAAYAGGSVLKWYRDHLSEAQVAEAERTGGDAYSILVDDSESAATDAPLVFLPHFYGSLTPTWQAQTKGALLGLTLHHRRADVTRAILEGIAFDTRWNIEQIRRLGIDLRAVTMIGGGAKSRTWAQIVADVCDVTVVIPLETEGACAGAAILAGVAAGVFNDCSSAPRLAGGTRLEPDPAAHVRYTRRFEAYKELFWRLADVWPRLADAGPEA